MHPSIFYVMHKDPLITVGPSGNNIEVAISRNIELAGRRTAYHFVQLYGPADKHLQSILNAKKNCATQSPNVHLIVMAATAEDQSFFVGHGIDAFVCNHNAFLDERIIFPQPVAQRPFDAVYTARFATVKRHELAAKVSRLALISGNWEVTKADIDRVFAECEAPAFSNVSRTGAIQFLNHHQVRGVLSASRCGLALSAEEGAMYASAEYLLCGLPVVTTASRGGRHEFFHPDYVDVVEDTADAVAAGVARMIARDIDTNMIRKRTLLLMREHRGRMLMRLSALLQANLFPQANANGWHPLFSHRLRTNS